MPPVMQPVLSSHVLEIGHDEAGLWVRYAPTVAEPAGALALFRGVPAEVAERIMAAPSIGSALHSEIRGRVVPEYPNRTESFAQEPATPQPPQNRRRTAAAMPRGRRQKW